MNNKNANTVKYIRKLYKNEIENPFSLLTEYGIEVDGLEKRNYEIYEVLARSLLLPARFDLIAKYIYIFFSQNAPDSEFGKDLYLRHIEAFTNGSFRESDNENKNNANQYEKEYQKVIDSIRSKGFDKNVSLIPAGEDWSILDGAHRVAAAAYFDKSVYVIKFNHVKKNYNYAFFKDKFLDTVYLDYMALTYCKLNPDTYMACVWPRAEEGAKRQEMEEVITSYSQIVYSKEVLFDYNGLRNFMIQVYGNEPWAGSYNNHFSGIYGQLDPCSSKNNKLKIYILKCSGLKEMLQMKKDIRDIFGVGNYSIHTTDTQNETIKLAELLLNENSIHYLINGTPDKYVNFNSKLNHFKESISHSTLSLNDFVIDSSGILGIYGIREPDDIDYLTNQNQNINFKGQDIDNHGAYLKYYNKTLDDLLYNPCNYCIYNGIKFTSLKILKEMKKNRNEPKDQQDIRMIDSVLIHGFNFSYKVNKIKYSLYRQYRTVRLMIKHVVKKMLLKIGVFETVKNIVQYLRKRNH